MIRLPHVVLLAILLIPIRNANGQAGVSSMSLGSLRSGIELRFDEIRIEELINYHRHKLPLPSEDDRLRLSQVVELDNHGNAVFQIGISTPRALDRLAAPPLNLVLVIDRSGSMAGDRIARVKQSLRALIETIREVDLVSIVSFSDEARVDLKPSRKSDRIAIEHAVDQLEARGATNLYDGLMLAYRIAKKRMDRNKSNRIILLTDGIANRGVTDSSEIARDSARMGRPDIDLSTIGLGADFNRQLLRELADKGRGTVHFVADNADIHKTFVMEVDSLLSPAARDVRMTLDFGQLEPKVKMFGYRPEVKGSKYKFQFENLNCGATQVVIGEVKKPQSPIALRLRYIDAVTGTPVEIRQLIGLNRATIGDNGNGRDFEKNYAIARLAEALQQSVKLCDSMQMENASIRLQRAIRRTRRKFKPCSDRDVDRIVALATNQKDRIAAAVKSQKNH
jgi:Mg-chelatase subunit ChlD